MTVKKHKSTAAKAKAPQRENILTKFLGGHFEPTHSKNLNWALDQAMQRQDKIKAAVAVIDNSCVGDDEALARVREILTA